MSMVRNKLLYSYTEAARMIGISPKTLVALVEQERITPSVVGSRTFIAKSEIKRLLKESFIRQYKTVEFPIERPADAHDFKRCKRCKSYFSHPQNQTQSFCHKCRKEIKK